MLVTLQNGTFLRKFLSGIILKRRSLVGSDFVFSIVEKSHVVNVMQITQGDISSGGRRHRVRRGGGHYGQGRRMRGIGVNRVHVVKPGKLPERSNCC